MPLLIDYQPKEQFLANQVIAVTGASSGIGRAVAIACARYGATVILLGRNERELETVYDYISDCNLATPVVCKLDFSTASEEVYSELSHMIGETFDQLHGLIHCAGVLGKMTTVGQYPSEIWNQVMQVNLTAPVLLTRALLSCLRQAERSAVVFTSSGVGRKGRAYWGAYSVSKFATEGLVQIMADEEKEISGVRINSFNPGATATPMRAQAYPAENPESVKTASQVASAYLYLMSRDSVLLQGKALSFDDPLPPDRVKSAGAA